MPLSPADLLRRYARLVVECGWGGKAGIAGKPVHVQHGVDAYPLLVAIAEEAYRQGAIRVDYTTWSPPLDALHVTYATEASLTDVPATWADRWNNLVDVRGATLRIEGVDDPFALARCPADRVSRFEAARIEARHRFYSEGLGRNTTPWCIIPFATSDWGRLLFGDVPDARERLEAALITVLGLDHDDYVERWWNRGARIARRSRLLDAADIEWLHITGPSTDLMVGLHPLARFGGGMHDGGDVRFFANLPTFENYTTPDRQRTKGVVLDDATGPDQRHERGRPARRVRRGPRRRIQRDGWREARSAPCWPPTRARASSARWRSSASTTPPFTRRDSSSRTSCSMKTPRATSRSAAPMSIGSKAERRCRATRCWRPAAMTAPCIATA